MTWLASRSPAAARREMAAVTTLPATSTAAAASCRSGVLMTGRVPTGTARSHIACGLRVASGDDRDQWREHDGVVAGIDVGEGGEVVADGPGAGAGRCL